MRSDRDSGTDAATIEAGASCPPLSIDLRLACRGGALGALEEAPRLKRQAFFGPLVALAVGVGSAQAAPIIPTFDTFGQLASATFNGSGIPNTAVAITTEGSVTLGLTAHQRYDNIAVTNDGLGTFFATVGPDASTGGNAAAGYATWNFAFYLADTDPQSGNLFNFFWDFDPAFGNDRSTHAGLVGFPLPANPHQDSLNLGMTFLTVFFNHPPVPTPPSFDPNAAGWHTFSLQAVDARGVVFAESAIRVQVGDSTPVPEPTTVALLGAGMVSLAAKTRRRARTRRNG